MKLFKKDGGPASTVSGLFVCEFKKLFTVVLLRFAPGTRDAYHSHAFNAISWVIKGRLVETFAPGDGRYPRIHEPSFTPIVTRTEDCHRVRSIGTTWVLSFRGPWRDRWIELLPGQEWSRITLTHGRRRVEV